MKKLIFLILFLNCFYSTFSQNLIRLDSNNGFKHLKFGMSLSKIKLVELNTLYTKSTENIKYYNYIGNDLKYIDGIPIDNIILAFYKNQLSGIQIIFGNIYKEFTDNETAIIGDALKSSFGYNFHNCVNSVDKLNCLIWDGKKVRCEFIRFHESEEDGTRNPNFNYITGYILFQYKPYVQERRINNF